VSGYGGQPPSGWQDPYDPYGQQQPGSGWQDPYAQQDPYGQGYGYGFGPPGMPTQSASNGSAIGALICNIVLTMTCCGVLAVPGIIMSAIAIGRVTSDPESARNLTMWSWIIFAANIVIVVVLVIVYFAFLTSQGSYQTTNY
jgi:hypothetical protein